MWRQGGDVSFSGKGPKQQQSITNRDQQTYRNVVRRAPLFPLNSVETVGVAYSRLGEAGDPTFNSAGFRDDVRDFFGSGSDTQELYIQPGRLTADDWKVLAKAAKWSRANSQVLVDTHWIGGDPWKFEPYGFASWSPRETRFDAAQPRQPAARVCLGREGGLRTAGRGAAEIRPDESLDGRRGEARPDGRGGRAAAA